MTPMSSENMGVGVLRVAIGSQSKTDEHRQQG